MCIYIYVYIYMYICEISIWSQSTCPLSNSGNYQMRRASICRSWPRTAAWSSWLSRGLKVENRQFYVFLLHRHKKRRGTFHKVSFLSGLPCKGLAKTNRCQMWWGFTVYNELDIFLSPGALLGFSPCGHHGSNCPFGRHQGGGGLMLALLRFLLDPQVSFRPSWRRQMKMEISKKRN